MMEGLRVALQFNEGIFYFKDMPEESFRKIFFNPVDFTSLLRQSISEWEETPFLQKVINSVIKKRGLKISSFSLVGKYRLTRRNYYHLRLCLSLWQS